MGASKVAASSVPVHVRKSFAVGVIAGGLAEIVVDVG